MGGPPSYLTDTNPMPTRGLYRLICVPLVFAAACATAQPRLEDDIAAQIKLISSYFPASVSRKADETSYLLYIYTPARGYQNTVTLTERPSDRLITVVVYERKGATRT